MKDVGQEIIEFRCHMGREAWVRVFAGSDGLPDAVLAEVDVATSLEVSDEFFNHFYKHNPNFFHKVTPFEGFFQTRACLCGSCGVSLPCRIKLQ